jgi:hypothetical protein
MTNKETNSYRIASKIFEVSGIIVNNDDKAKNHAQLENLISEMEEIENIKVDESIEYFDFGRVWQKMKEEGSGAELTEIVEIAATEQVERWLAKLANLVTTQLSETMYQLEDLHSAGLKINGIRNHPDFHFLSGYLARFSEEIEQKVNADEKSEIIIKDDDV